MKTKALHSLPIFAISIAAVILHFAAQTSHPLLTDIGRILTPYHPAETAQRSRTIDSFIVAYKNELHILRERQTEYEDIDSGITTDLRIAELHMKYADQISERGFKWSEVQQLVYKADKTVATTHFCDNIGYQHLHHMK